MHQSFFPPRRKVTTPRRLARKWLCRTSALQAAVGVLLLLLVAVMVLGARLAARHTTSNGVEVLEASKQHRLRPRPPRRFADFQKLAVDLVRKSPAEMLAFLEKNDPFGTRMFERRLEETETSKGRILTLDEVKGLFPCPRDRITLPDLRNHSQAQAFRDEVPGTFLFFQHLRKAGGTHFCALAEHNFPRAAIPRYYCMPDYHWTKADGKESDCAGCLAHWTNEEIVARIGPHRIAGNEWDKFEPDRHLGLPAALATSFRRPVDRALSQFRFECLEDRGCKIKEFSAWWRHRRDLVNVYTWTFGRSHRVTRISFDDTFAEERAATMESAIDTVARFHLVLSMEWLAYAGTSIQAILGFHDLSAVTERVRPHITQAMREDHQERNHLGAAGISKASWSAKDYLTPEQYEELSEGLAMDEVLTDAARRMFLERVVCPDLIA